MKELIKPVKNSKGEDAYPARSLYSFLELDPSQFSRWAKKNIETNQFAIEGIDYEHLDMMSNRGNGVEIPIKEYALSIVFCKKLSMLARTAKGEEARDYFIECEKKLTQVKQVIQPAVEKLQRENQSLKIQIEGLQHLLRIQENRANDAREMVEIVQKQGDKWYEEQQHTREMATYFRDLYRQEAEMCRDLRKKVMELAPVKQTAEVKPADAQVPDLPTTTKVRMMVDDHCKKTGSHQEAIWNELYLLMYYHHGISINRWTRPKGVSKLQEIERRGYAEKLLALAVQHFATNQVAA